MFEVTDKVIVITGGTGVLGNSIAKCLVNAGAKVVIIGRNPDKLSSALKSAENNENLIGFACDVLDKTRLHKVKDQIIEKWGSINVLMQRRLSRV